MKEFFDTLRAVPWMLLMWIFLAFSYIQEEWYKYRKIGYKRTCEGFVYRDKK